MDFYEPYEDFSRQTDAKSSLPEKFGLSLLDL